MDDFTVIAHLPTGINQRAGGLRSYCPCSRTAQKLGHNLPVDLKQRSLDTNSYWKQLYENYFTVGIEYHSPLLGSGAAGSGGTRMGRELEEKWLRDTE